MKILGHDKQVRLYAIDTMAYEGLKAMVSNGDMTKEQASIIPNAIQLDKNPGPDWRPDLRIVWRQRVLMTLTLLKEGWTIMLTDVDSLWMKHVDIVNGLPKNFDVIHAVAGGWPPTVNQLWGFTHSFQKTNCDYCDVAFKN